MPNYQGSAQVTIPQLDLSAIEGQSFIQDLTFDTSDRVKIVENNVGDVLKLSTSGSISTNQYIGSQVVINSDRIILNSKDDYLMLFGSKGVSISSKEPVNIDTDSSFTVFADSGVYVGLPNKGNDYDFANQKAPNTKGEPTPNTKYEPLVLGSKLANLIEDLITILQSSIIVTPVGKAKFREDTLYELANLRARLPEILSTYAYIDGVSHESPETPPSPPAQITDPSGIVAIQGNFTTNDTGITNNVATYIPNVIPSEALKAVPGYYDILDLQIANALPSQNYARISTNGYILPSGKDNFIEEGNVTIHKEIKTAFDAFKQQLITVGIPSDDVYKLNYNLSWTSKYVITEEVRSNIALTDTIKPLYLDMSLDMIASSTGSAEQILANLDSILKTTADTYITNPQSSTNIYKTPITTYSHVSDLLLYHFYLPTSPIYSQYDPRATGKFLQLDQEIPRSVLSWICKPENKSPFVLFANNVKYLYYVAKDTNWPFAGIRNSQKACFAYSDESFCAIYS